jgi:hypothetical protein
MGTWECKPRSEAKTRKRDGAKLMFYARFFVVLQSE